MKGFIGLLAGIVVAAVVMMAVGYVGTSLYPLHVPADPSDRQALIEGIRTAPVGAQLTLLLSWFRVAAHMVNEGEQIAFCHGMDVQENVLFSQEDDSGKL